MIERLTGQWTYTPVMAAASWHVRKDDADGLVAQADFFGIGAAPAEYLLRFDFDVEGRIARIVESFVLASPPVALPGMTPWLRRYFDRALAEGKTVTVSYVDEEGLPSLSLRGSIHTIDDCRFGLWLRKPTGGLANAIERGSRIALLYRDHASRTTLIALAKGCLISDDSGRAGIFDGSPEVEQRHDPARAGAAAVLDLIELKGTSPRGPVLVRCSLTE